MRLKGSSKNNYSFSSRQIDKLKKQGIKEENLQLHVDQFRPHFNVFNVLIAVVDDVVDHFVVVVARFPV